MYNSCKRILTKFTYLTNDERTHKILNDLKIKCESKNIVYIFGGGHVSIELKKILKYVGFEYVVLDDREEFANEERFVDAKRVLCANYDNILDKINITNNDFVVTMTRGHSFDYMVMKQVLKTDAFYIGMIGSEAKNKTIKDKLLEDGYTNNDLDRICAPIGIQIAAETPEEIAISIASELILFRSILEKRKKIINGNKLLELYTGKIRK